MGIIGQEGITRVGRRRRSESFDQGIFQRAQGFSRLLHNPQFGLGLALLEAMSLLMKPQLDHADFSKVLSVDQADAQMQQYFQSLGADDKNQIKEVFSAGEAADRESGLLADGEAPGALQYSKYLLQSEQTNILEKILALDFINAWSAQHQRQTAATA